MSNGCHNVAQPTNAFEALMTNNVKFCFLAARN